jgi:aminoglycoside phosphotransferase (APT) family kinase protein
MAAYDEKRVRAALSRVWPDAATAKTAQIRALAGGLSARTFLAVAGPRHYVLRLPIEGDVAWLDLATEARAMRAAAAADLAPSVIAVDVEAGLLLTEYRVMPWTPELVRQPIAVTMIGRLLRALHALDVELPVFAVEQIATGYLAALDASTVPLGAEQRGWADELMRLGRHFDASYAATAFCHNDLAAANILVDGAAGRGAPLLDLASLAAMNDFAVAQRSQLLDEYYGKASAAPTLRDLGNAIRVVRLLAYFWARVAEQRITGTDVHAELAASIAATLRQD